MKKLFLSIVLIVLTIVSLSAQASYGVKAGVNLANLSADDIEDNKILTSFHVGFFVEIDLSETISLQPELLYSAQGAKFEEEEDGFSVSTDLKVNYINLPIMFKFNVAEGFNLEVGPQIGFLVSAELFDEDIKDEVESFDFGVNVGFSFDFTEELFAQARYNLGLANIAADSDADKTKNSVISVSLGYKFN